jgi:hypothetical protein
MNFRDKDTLMINNTPTQSAKNPASKFLRTLFVAVLSLSMGITGLSSASAAELVSIAVTTPATKVTYTVGETLDIAGLVITGTYDDATEVVETVVLADVTGFDSSAPADDQVLTVTVGAVTTTYTVDIVAAAPTPSAVIANVNVSGTTGSTIASQEAVITLTDDTFNAISINADLSGWVSNEPTGITITAKTAVSVGGNSVILVFAGTPSSAVSAPMAITIPSASLVSAANLVVASNSNAKFTINVATPVVVTPTGPSEAELAAAAAARAAVAKAEADKLAAEKVIADAKLAAEAAVAAAAKEAADKVAAEKANAERVAAEAVATAKAEAKALAKAKAAANTVKISSAVSGTKLSLNLADKYYGEIVQIYVGTTRNGKTTYVLVDDVVMEKENGAASITIKRKLSKGQVLRFNAGKKVITSIKVSK